MKSFVDVVLQYNDSYNDQILCLRQFHSQSRTAARI